MQFSANLFCPLTEEGIIYPLPYYKKNLKNITQDSGTTQKNKKYIDYWIRTIWPHAVPAKKDENAMRFGKKKVTIIVLNYQGIVERREIYISQ